MMTTAARTTIARTKIARTCLAASAAAALALAGCSSDGDVAEFEEANGNQAANSAEPSASAAPEPEAPRTEPGFRYEDFSREIEVTESIRPERSEVITPAGTLQVTEVQAIEQIPAAEIGLEGQATSGSSEAGGSDVNHGTADAEPVEYAPAEGEVFRAVDVTFTPDELTGEETSANLSFEAGGSQLELQELDDQDQTRILLSVPEDGSGRLIVSSEGHDQYLDVLTGERDEDDEVAAGYYRQVTRQEPNHTFAIDDAVFPTDFNGDPDDDVIIDSRVQISSVSLTGWSQEGGWAAPGEAWLNIAWDYEFDADTDSGSGADRVSEVTATLAVTTASGSEEVEVYQEGGGSRRDDVLSTVPVPIDTVEVELGVSGSLTASASGFRNVTGDDSATFASDTLEISFPDEGSGATPTDEDPDDSGDSGEATEAPTDGP